MKRFIAIVVIALSGLSVGIVRADDGPHLNVGDEIVVEGNYYCIDELLDTESIPMSSGTGVTLISPFPARYWYIEYSGTANSDGGNPYNLLDFTAGDTDPNWAPFIYDYVRDNNTADWGYYDGGYPGYHTWVLAAPDTHPFASSVQASFRYRGYDENPGGSLTMYSYAVTVGHCPTPTPSPTVPPTLPAVATATALPLSTQACVVPTQSSGPTARPTTTPFGPTPTRTPTPTGTYTATVSATATPSGPASSITVGPAKFSQSLSPWTSSAGFFSPYSTTRVITSETGNDGSSGVAIIGWYAEPSSPITGTYMAAPALMHIRTLTYTSIGYFPGNAARLTGQAKSDAVWETWRSDLQVWTLDLTPTGAQWTKRYTIPVTSAWRFFDATITWPVGVRVGGIAITARQHYTVIGPPPATPAPGGGVRVDDLLLTAGEPGSGYENAGLPVCSGYASGGTTRPPVSTRLCTIATTRVDVLGRACPVPAATDLAAWIPFLGCRVVAYFTFNNANREQMTALITRQEQVEPFGTMSELDDVYYQFELLISGLNNRNQVEGADIDLASLLSTDEIPNPLENLNVQDVEHVDVISTCPSQVMSFGGAAAADGACMAIWMLRQSPAITILQYALNLGSLVMIVRYLNAKWRSMVN